MLQNHNSSSTCTALPHLHKKATKWWEASTQTSISEGQSGTGQVEESQQILLFGPKKGAQREVARGIKICLNVKPVLTNPLFPLRLH